MEENMQTIKKELDLFEEKRYFTLKSIYVKEVAATNYNKKVRPPNF